MKKKWRFISFKDLPEREKRVTISTLFTLLRIILVPFIVWFTLKGKWGYALLFFLVAALSDVVDGNLARWYNEQTFLGACLDPIADKLLVLSCFMVLAFVEPSRFSIPTWFLWLVFLKEIMIFFGAIFLYYKKGYDAIRPTMLGKAAAVVQMGFIMWVFCSYYVDWNCAEWHGAVVGLTAGVIAATFVQYSWIGYSSVLMSRGSFHVDQK